MSCSEPYCATQFPSDWFTRALSTNYISLPKETTNQPLIKSKQSISKTLNNNLLYIDTRWCVIWKTDEEKLPMEEIQKQLQWLNSSLTDIQLLPLNYKQLTVTYVEVSREALNSKNPLEEAISVCGIMPKLLNIFIGNCQGNTKGQALYQSNAIFCHYKARDFLMHQIGHVLSLGNKNDTFKATENQEMYDYLSSPNNVSLTLYPIEYVSVSSMEISKTKYLTEENVKSEPGLQFSNSNYSIYIIIFIVVLVVIVIIGLGLIYYFYYYRHRHHTKLTEQRTVTRSLDHITFNSTS